MLVQIYEMTEESEGPLLGEFSFEQEPLVGNCVVLPPNTRVYKIHLIGKSQFLGNPSNPVEVWSFVNYDTGTD